ncbi:nitrogenase component 1, partial [Candidatus Symbiopectobacterium sp. NZEC135]
MKGNDILALLDEPACEHNHKQKTGCSAPKPGATAGGCAFDGAQITLLPLADVAHLVHGPIGCAGSSWDNRGSQSSGPRLNRLGFTTDLNEQDVIMGRGERRLFHAVRHIVERYDPAAVFVYNTCVPAMEGDDIDAVCRAATVAVGVPVIAVDAAGFYGSKNFGNRLAGEVMLKQVIGTREPAPWPESSPIPVAQRHDIGLIGEFNIAGEFWHVHPLLDELGIRVLGNLSGDGRFAEIQTLHRAQANMLVCSRALINVARSLEQRYGTPWFEGSFYGVRAMSDALRQLAALLQDDSLMQRTETLIAREEAAAEKALAPYRARLKGRKALLYT